MDITVIDTTLERLRALEAENPGIREAAQFYQRLIPALHKLSAGIPGLTTDQEVLDQKLKDGIPVLLSELLEFDVLQTRRVFETISEAIMNGDDGTGSARQKVRNIYEAMRTGALDPVALLAAVGDGEVELLEEVASRLHLDPRVLEMLAQNTLKVFLRAWQGALEDQIHLEDWRRSACPFCGASPALAEIRGVESARYLRCLRCGAAWPYSNLCCAYCGNTDHHTLGILLVHGESHKRYVHTCDRCKHYIKTVVTFERIPVDIVIVEDLATLQLDYLAVERGYVK